MRNNISTPVSGEDFYGREKELQQAHELLDSGHSLILSAPRRAGKSSLATRLYEQKATQGWKTVYIDLEGIFTRQEFLKKLLAHLDNSSVWDKTKLAGKKYLSKTLALIRKIGPIQFDFKDEWELNQIFSDVAEAIDHTQDTLIVVDELTLFLDNIDSEDSPQEVRNLLNWLRSLRQVVHGSKIRWLFSGSIGLFNFTALRKVAYSINDMVEVDLDAMTDQEASGMLKALVESERMDMDGEVQRYLLDKIGWPFPYFIQLAVSILRLEESRVNGISREDVDEALQKIINGKYLRLWALRLEEYNGYRDMARFILEELAAKSEGRSKKELMEKYRRQKEIDSDVNFNYDFSETLGMLQSDSYITRTDQRFKFVSPILREWWKAKFGI